MGMSSTYDKSIPHKYKLKVLQQPSKARLCSFKEKVDRRPIDPPPIVQLYCTCHPQQQQQQCHYNFLHNPYFFLYANLTSITDDTDLYIHHGHRTTAGAVVQSLHKLKDTDNNDGGFFVFADVSVRLEGNYRLKFTLFEIAGEHVKRLVSVISNPFTVYSPKHFPGMSESSLLTKSFSDQGVRIRIRKDTRHTSKRQRTDNDPIKMEENLESEKSPNTPLILPPLPSSSSSISSKSNLTTPSKSAMSMQNILSPPLYENNDFYSTRTLPPPSRLFSHPLPPVLPPQFPDSSPTSTL
ncbi:velvet factor-domain-containing protein [Halteromyces radiatus]|uniref:velvet factor-domain-containing protein n=1 Tax=Halteromyces radiatus TaxID=101107 RepID=UPI002220A7F8|nr:velvet factor-domain-containing protein [Halteromyces radiatus]KAI8082964.1 velvet factor-domain-containing protein [Halteromyces radiatus]